MGASTPFMNASAADIDASLRCSLFASREASCVSRRSSLVSRRILGRFTKYDSHEQIAGGYGTYCHKVWVRVSG